MRTNFDHQLQQLNINLIKMGALCEEAITAAAACLIQSNSALIDTVDQHEHAIDQMERDIESLCMKLILQQQPVAKDLRTISSALKMISDMERIGDQAQDIVETSANLPPNPLSAAVHIEDMAKATCKMVTDSIDSFVRSDLDLVRAVIDYDDVVDDLFDQVKQELALTHSNCISQSEQCLDLLMIAKYFERIGDHATNIAEWVEYAITGHHRSYNQLQS